MSPPRPRTNLPAELLSLGYSVSRKLGRGSTAEVYEARHVASGRPVAVKVGRADVADAQRIVDRMQTEWNVGRGLRHPNLVEIIDGGSLSDGRAWLAMERLIGHDLHTELQANAPLPPMRVVHLARQICEALQVVHRRGAVHRDVKPENIFLLTAHHLYPDHVKLIDLGVLALPADDPERAHESTGQFIVGTPMYLAPEQATGELPEPRTDLYALGAVIYHMLAGRPPFEDEDPTEVVRRHVNDEVPPLDTLVSDLPSRLVALVHACLSKDAAHRPPDASRVIELLDACSRDLTAAYDTAGSLRSAPMPPVPAPGNAMAWVTLSEQLEQLTGMFFRDRVPAPLKEGLKRMAQAGRGLERAKAEAERRRQVADDAARERIEQRDRLQRRQRKLEAGFARVEARLRDARQALATAEAGVLQHDERYGALLESLRGMIGSSIAATPLPGLAARHAQIDALLEARTPQVASLNRARSAERKAAEALASLRAQSIDLQAAFADLEVEDQEEGTRDERGAEGAIAARTTAERFFERAVLRVLIEYAQALAPALR